MVIICKKPLCLKKEMSSMFSTTEQNPPVVLKMDEVNLKRVYIKKSHNFLENYFLSAGSTEVDITTINCNNKCLKWLKKKYIS